jgi:hypothetical protein
MLPTHLTDYLRQLQLGRLASLWFVGLLSGAPWVARETVKGSRLDVVLAGADERIQRYARAIGAEVAEVDRNGRDQYAAVKSGASDAFPGESPHDYVLSTGVPAADLYMNLSPGLGHVTHDEELAHSLGLKLGREWGDPPHVEVATWREDVRREAAAGLPMVSTVVQLFGAVAAELGA